MATASLVVKRIIDSRPLLQEALLEEIVNFANLAEKLKPKVEAELGVKVERQAIIMALRRHSEMLSSKSINSKNFRIDSEIIMKTGICDLCVSKTQSALEKLRKIHQFIDFSKGETLNIIQGNNEVTIVSSQKNLSKLKEILKGERILNVEKDLASLTLSLSKDFLYTPGVIAFISRKLAWENINVFENISTMTELIFIISEKDSARAYNALREIVKT